MSEADWQSCSDPQAMLEVLRSSGNASDRKLRLFACACCRRVWNVIENERIREAIETAEQYADSVTTQERLKQVEEMAWDIGNGTVEGVAAALAYIAGYVAGENIDNAVHAVVDISVVAWPNPHKAAGFVGGSASEMATARLSEGHKQGGLFRDIFGNPFGPTPTINPSLLTPAIVGFANQIYEQRTFDQLPALGDMLAEAGCTDAELLAHLRSEGPHVRGCWALDVVLATQ